MLGFITGVLFFVDIVCAFLLIGIILIQQSKSGGGLGAIAGGMTESVFGAAAGNVITKTTVVLAATFLVTTLALAVISGHTEEARGLADRLQEQAQNDLSVPPGGADVPVDSGAAVPPDAGLPDVSAEPVDAEPIPAGGGARGGVTGEAADADIDVPAAPGEAALPAPAEAVPVEQP
jgi:preprotein translocase subunit SecG